MNGERSEKIRVLLSIAVAVGLFLLVPGYFLLARHLQDRDKIRFADPQFEARLVTRFDTNNDGRIDIKEAHAVTWRLDCRNSEITDLTGIELFKNLKSLDCSSNALKCLPSLPPNLEELVCDQNGLTSLPKLPKSLRMLECAYNRLEKIDELPANLEKLDCSSNHLSQLPGLPKNLIELDCRNNELEDLPDLPETLQSLDCSFNTIDSLPPLPPGLEKLVCDRNQLELLPELPAALEHLDCRCNVLINLPELPARLDSLRCYGNRLTGESSQIASAFGEENTEQESRKKPDSFTCTRDEVSESRESCRFAFYLQEDFEKHGEFAKPLVTDRGVNTWTWSSFLHLVVLHADADFPNPTQRIDDRRGFIFTLQGEKYFAGEFEASRSSTTPFDRIIAAKVPKRLILSSPIFQDDLRLYHLKKCLRDLGKLKESKNKRRTSDFDPSRERGR